MRINRVFEGVVERAVEQVEHKKSFTDPTPVVAPTEISTFEPASATTSPTPAPLPAAPAAADLKEWPGGKPEHRLISRIEQLPIEVPRHDQIATLLAALSPEQAASTQALINDGVSDASLKAAYEAVLAARTTPGQKVLEFSLTPMVAREVSGLVSRRDLASMPARVEGTPVSVAASIEVAADGAINGKPLMLDEVARFASELSTLHPDTKLKALRDAGITECSNVDYALGKLRLAASKPGTHSIDLSFVERVESVMGEGSVEVSFNPRHVVLKLEVGEDGKINGKTPFVETALATQLTMERLSMDEKRVLLSQLGFPEQACVAMTPGEAADALARASLATLQPGEHRLEVGVAGKGWDLGLKIGEKGAIESTGAAPHPPKQAGWKKVIGPLLTVASFIFPVAAPVLRTINAVIAVANGAKGLSLIGSLMGAAGELGQMANIAGASTLSSMASGINAANGVAKGLKSGDLLGVLSSAASLASSVGSLTGQRVDGTFNLIGRVASVANAVVKKDIGALAGLVIPSSIQVDEPGPSGATDGPEVNVQVPSASVADFDGGGESHPADPDGSLPYVLGGARFGESGVGTVRLGTGDAGGDSMGASSQADVRRVDNEIFGHVVRVAAGDSLSRIAATKLGDPARAAELYAWNALKLGADPNSVRAGIDLELPPASFSLTGAERAAFFRLAHLPPPPSTPPPTTAVSVSVPTTTPAQPTPSTPAPVRVDSGEVALPSGLSPEWGGFDAQPVGDSRTPAFIAASRIKFELTAGTFKAELAVSPESWLSIKTSKGNAWDKSVMLQTGALKFSAEPAISVDLEARTFQVVGKVQGGVGPVTVALRGSIDSNGLYRVEAPSVGVDPGWLKAGFKFFGLGATLKLETGPVFRAEGKAGGQTETPPELEYLNGHHSP